MIAATGGIALLYLASFVLGFFNINVPVIHDSGWLGIASACSWWSWPR